MTRMWHANGKNSPCHARESGHPVITGFCNLVWQCLLDCPVKPGTMTIIRP
jgi:hypothetical protein